jgi:hypothetical protein
MEFIISMIGVYVIFRILDWIFSGSRPMKIREGDYVQKIGDHYYLVREVNQVTDIENEVEAPPRERPDLRIVK